MIGVNLLYGAFYYPEPAKLISSLQENLAPERLQVDMIKFSGPAFENVDNRLMSLSSSARALPLLSCSRRMGKRFSRPRFFTKRRFWWNAGASGRVTHATNDMLDGARTEFLKQSGATEKDLVVLMEMTLENLLSEGEFESRRFPGARRYPRGPGPHGIDFEVRRILWLGAYLARYTNKMIGLVMGLPSLLEIFDEKYYLNLEGGILEALGRMFKGGLKLFVYPMVDEKNNFNPPLNMRRIPPSRFR